MMRGKPDFARFEARALIGGLVLLAIGSIVTAAFNVEPAWQTPLVLVALLVIIRLLTPVEEIHTDVRFLREAADSVSVELFPGVEPFYRQLAIAREKGTATLDLTHIRDEPPEDFGDEAAGWSDTVAEWLDAGPGRSVRRIISVRSQSMRAWAEHLEQHEASKPGYEVKVVDWQLKAPAVNMVIIDQKVVFLAITGDTARRTKALGIEDAVSGEYFSSYYTRLWASGTELSDWLVANPLAAGSGDMHP